MDTEDRVSVFECDDALVVVVADGAGGISGGGVASEAIVDAVRAQVGVAERRWDPYDLRAWSALFVRTDRMLVANRAAGETTAVVAVVGVQGVAGVSVGDREAWVLAHRSDRLTDGQDRRRLGTGRSRPTPFHRRALDGVLVIATDGLFRHAPADAISECCAAGDASAVAETLVHLPRRASANYPDDVGIVVISAQSPAP